MKKKWFGCCLSIVLTPFLVCGLYYGAVTLYVALTELPYDDERVDAYALLPAETTGAAVLTDLRLREDTRLKFILPHHRINELIDPIFVSV